MTLKINTLNWSSLLVNEDVDIHYEVAMQLYYGDNKPLSKKTMVPLARNLEGRAN